MTETYDVRISSEGTLNQRAHCYRTDISRCLDTGGEDPDSNHGGGWGGGDRNSAPPQGIVCGNPWDSQSKRVFHGDGSWHSLSSNSGGGQSRDAVLTQGVDKQQTYVYDARGNGDGDTVSTLTGDHQNRVTDYTTVCVDGERTYQDTTGALLASGYDKLGTQEAANDMHVTDSKAYSATVGSFMIGSEEQTATLMARDYKDPPITAKVGSVVRRLTPLECERLQGLPDIWTNLGTWKDSKGKRHKEADAPRYKAIGNGIAVPFWDWMLRRISSELGGTPTIGSLFDGIGTFPLIWESINGIGTARWSSEIEEFPMAVSKKHLGDEDAGIEGDIALYLGQEG